MSTPAVKDLTFYSGDDQVIQFVAKDAAKTVVDLTGATAKMQLKISKSEDSYVMEKVGAVVGNLGQVTITYTPADVIALSGGGANPKSYVYDIQLTLADTTVVTVLTGKVTVLKDVIS